MVTKRAHIDIDPDYEDVTEHQSKRQRFLEEDAKETTRRKIEIIVKRQVSLEIRNKEVEIDNVDRALHQARITMDRLRACIVANYFGSAGQQRFPQGNSQQAIHPTVKDVIGKRPKDYPPEIKKEPSSSIVIKSEPLPVPTDTADYKSVTSNAANTVVKMEAGSSGLPSNVDQKVISHHDSRTARFKIKKRIIVGNVSKYIPVDRRDENDQSTHKWMVYVRGPKDEPKIDHFVKKVWFFLHPSYRPNDLVEVSSSPFHLTRRGWGEFPVRVQLHFKDQRNKRLDIIHQLKLDRTYTGLQTLGAETVVDIELEKEKFEEKVPTPSLLRPTFSGGDSTLIAKMSETVSVKQENNITIPEQISPKKIKVEDSVFKNHLQGKVVQNGTAAMFSDKENQLKIEFKQTTETQNASKNANKIVIDASNQSLQSVVSALISNPNSLVQSGNIMVLQNILSQNKAGTGAPGNSLIIGPASQGVTRTSSNIKAETSGSGSKVSIKQAADVVKSSAPSSAQGVVSTGATYTLIKSVSPEKGKTLVRSTSSAGNLIVSPGVTKSPSVAMVTQVSTTSTLEGSKLIGQTNTAMQSVATGLQGTLIPQQAATIAKQTVAASSVLPQKTVTMATNSVTTQMTVQSAATQIKQPMKQNQILYTKQQSVTMPTLQHTVTSAKSVAMTTTSSLQSATTSTASQTFYVRCKDNQGNIFLVPHHLLKQVSQAPTMTTAACSTSSVNLTKGNLMTSPDSKKNVVGKASSLTNSITSSTSSQQIQVAANSSSGPASLCIKIEPQSQAAQSNITTLLSSILPQQASAVVPQTLLTSNKQEALPTPTASMNVKAGSGPLLLIKTDQSATSSSLSSGVLKPSSSSEENTFSVVDGKLVQSIASSAPSQLQLHLQGQISQLGTKGQGQLKVTSQGLKNIQEDVKSKILKGIPQSSNSSIVKSEIKSENKIPSKSCQLASLLKGDISAAHRNAKMATPTSQSSPQCVKGTIPVLGASTSSQGQTSLLALTSNVNVKSPLLLVGQDERKQTVAKSLVSGKPVANWNTQGTRPISGQSILTNIANGKGSQTVSTTSVTQSNPTSILTSQPLTFAKGQVNPAVQSKTVLAKIGNQTLLLQLPLTDASSAVAIDNTKGKPLSVSSCVTMAATKSESQNSVSIVTPASNKYLQSRHLGKSLSMQHLDDEKRILNWKKKKCYLTAPVPVKPIPPLKVTDYPDVVSLVRAAIKRHPIISSTADLFQHPYCARQREQWLGWNVGKRRASEWQRASSCRKYLRKQLNGELTFKREKLWTTKQIMCWCRLHAYSPHYLEKTLHPDSSDLMMEVMVGKKLSTATGIEAVLGRVDDIQIRQRHDSSGDEDVDIVSIEPPKVKVKEESPVKEEVKAPDIIPPSPEALFVQDISQKIGVKFSPSPVNDVLHASLSEDVVYTAMKSFIGEIITEAFAVKVNMGRYPDGLGVADIYKALSNLPQADFLTNKHLGINDQDR